MRRRHSAGFEPAQQLIARARPALEHARDGFNGSRPALEPDDVGVMAHCGSTEPPIRRAGRASHPEVTRRTEAAARSR
jgi:hypothetical protein